MSESTEHMHVISHGKHGWCHRSCLPLKSHASLCAKCEVGVQVTVTIRPTVHCLKPKHPEYESLCSGFPKFEVKPVVREALKEFCE